MTEEQTIEMLAHLSVIEGLLYIVCGVLIAFISWGVFRLCSKFLDMFFN